MRFERIRRDVRSVLVAERLEERRLLWSGVAGDGILDLTFVSDSYADFSKFHADVQKSVDRLFTYQPFKSRQEQFRIHEIENSDFLNVGFASGAGADGLTASWFLVNQVIDGAQVPTDFVVVMTDYPGVFGGSATVNGPDIVLTADTAGYYVLAHELGHAIGGLNDEYLYGSAGERDIDQQVHANRFAGSAPAAEWADLVAPDEYTLGAGDAANWYRPSPRSLMNVNGGAGYNAPSLILMNQGLDYWAGPLTDTEPPVVQFHNLTSGSSVSGVVSVALDLSDNRGVARTQLWVDGKLARNSFEVPFAPVWKTGSLALGTHRLLAKAFDNAGNVGTTQEITVNLTHSSDFQITTPKPGSTISLKSRDTFDVAVTGWFGEFAKLSLLINGQENSYVYPVPDGWVFHPQFMFLDPGINTLTVVAYDASYTKELYRDSIQVVQKEPDPLGASFKDIYMFAKPLHGVVNLPLDVTSGVRGVELSVDDQSVGIDTTAPFGFTLDTRLFPDGDHILFLRAFGTADDYRYGEGAKFNNSPNAPLVVGIDAPAAGEILHGLVSVETNIRSGSANSVKLYVDDKLVSTSTNSPFGFTLNTRKWRDGTHTLKLVASGPKGTSKASRKIVFRNAADRAVPTVTVTSPKNNAVFGTNGMSITGHAADNVGVVRVQLLIDNQVVDTSTNPKFQFLAKLTGFKKGRHTLIVRAFDAAGNAGNSKTVSVTKQA